MQRARRAKLNRMPSAVHVDVRNDLHAQENAYDIKCISLSVMDFRYRSEPISSRPAGQSIDNRASIRADKKRHIFSPGF